MGLLDDAIREHLDLKRRHGADPSEIERAEREALGPVRRGPEVTGEETAPAAPAAEPAPEHPPVPSDHAPEPSEEWERFDEDPELRALEEHEDLPYEPARAPEGDPLMDDETFADETAGAPAAPPADISPAPESEPSLAPHPADPPPPPAPSAPPPEGVPPHLDQETEEYELEPEEEADDDVLESTPEFLQDAPEHDRLWFEQRPPRDFDFDG